MNPVQFIQKEVIAELTKLGYEKSVAQQGADKAIDLYKRASQASARGRMFDDCLREAKLWASKLQPRRKVTRT